MVRSPHRTAAPRVTCSTRPPSGATAPSCAPRVVLGVVLVAHGWQKVDGWGIGGTAVSVGERGVPAPRFPRGSPPASCSSSAHCPLLTQLVVATMAGAFWSVHQDGGVFVAEGGWELVAVIAAAALALAGAGTGRLSVDGLLGRRGHRADDRTDGDRAGAPVGDATRA